MPLALAETSNPRVRAGAPRASAVLIGMVGPPPTTGPAYRSDTSSEEVGEATLARSARSGLLQPRPGLETRQGSLMAFSVRGRHRK